MFRKERLKKCDSVFWLLREPVVHGTRLRCEAEPTVLQKLCEARIVTLGRVVEVCGPHLDDATGLTSRLGIRSVRVVSLLLRANNAEFDLIPERQNLPEMTNDEQDVISEDALLNTSSRD
ncbi:hypothetical protein ABVT39_013641 [Epinephelus coioides]